MKKFKKLMASLLAISSMAICMTGISANAASWTIGFNSTSSSSSYKTCTVSVESVVHEKSVTIGSALERFSGASSSVNVRGITSSISGVNLTHKSTGYLSKKITSCSDTELALRVTLYGNAGYSSAGGQVLGSR